MHGFRVRWTRWDSRALLRAALVAALALMMAWLVTAATDEGGVRWGERAGRTLPLTPACAAIGTWIALQPVRSRGEARALEALGRSPAQLAAAAVAGGALVAIAAAVAIGALARVDVAAFYPAATRVGAWRWDGAQFVDVARGLRVAADGTIGRASTLPSAGLVAANAIPSHGRAAAALTTVIAGLALPLLVAHALLGRAPGTRMRREDLIAILASGVAVASSVVLFQAAAARLAPAMLAVIPAALLLAIAVRRYRASS